MQEALKVPRGTESKKTYEKSRDRIVAALAKMVRFIQDTKVRIQASDTWLDHLPLKHDKAEYIENHQLLADTLNEDPEGLIQNSSKAFERIIKICLNLFESKFTQKETDEKLRLFLQKAT